MEGRHKNGQHESRENQLVTSIYRFLTCHNQGITGMFDADTPIADGMGPLLRFGSIAAAVQNLNDCEEKHIPVPIGLSVTVELALIEYVINNNDIYEADKRVVPQYEPGDRRIEIIENKLQQLLPHFEMDFEEESLQSQAV